MFRKKIEQMPIQEKVEFTLPKGWTNYKKFGKIKYGDWVSQKYCLILINLLE